MPKNWIRRNCSEKNSQFSDFGMQRQRLKMRRGVYPWNLMIRNSTQAQTLALYSSMLQTGLHGNGFTFPLVFKACAALVSLRDGASVHSHVLQLGFRAHLFVQTALLDMYSKCHDLASSRKVFDEMPTRSIVSWNSIIAAYCRSSLLCEAFPLLRQMGSLGLQLTSTSFLSLLSATSVLLPQGLSLHCCILKLGLEELSLINALMSMYVKCGQLREARAVFDTMYEKSIISWTTIIGGYLDAENANEAFRLFNEMRRSFLPDPVVFINLIKGCVQEGNLLLASSFHSLALKTGCYNANLLLSMYAKCGDVVSARQVFDTVNVKSLSLWTSMISSYTHLGYPVEALDVFNKLLGTSIKPDGATIACILSACADMGSPSIGRQIEEYILIHGLQSNRLVQTSLIQMYSKCGNIEKAKEVFEEVSTKDLAFWSSMINSYAIHGMGVEALSLFHEMQKMEGIKPDAVIYTSVLLACSHSGLVKDGLKYFQSMQKDFGIAPRIEHYICLVDILGRAGQLELAMKAIKVMPFKVQAQAWAPFLSACRKHHNIELGEFAAKKLLDMSPGSNGNYVLMANLYASVGKWKEAAETRSLMEDRGLDKKPGWSMVDINGSFHVFIAGDRSHHQSTDIYKKLNDLNAKLLEAGYVPRTDIVLHDLEKEEKEEILKVHSERLAIAFGLIRTEPNAALRIVKSLRTCEDCHSTLKLISKITGRLLIVRDGHRFHHFASGSCSCKDFW